MDTTITKRIPLMFSAYLGFVNIKIKYTDGARDDIVSITAEYEKDSAEPFEFAEESVFEEQELAILKTLKSNGL